MFQVKTSIGVILHLHTEGNATGDNFNEMAASKFYDSPAHPTEDHSKF